MGTASSWQLRGEATAPIVEPLPANAVLETAAKKTLNILLPIRNWSKESQTFNVESKILGENVGAQSLTGAKTMSIGPLGARNYKIAYYAYSPASVDAKITFMNPS